MLSGTKKSAPRPRYVDMVRTAIGDLDERTGSSRQMITKYIVGRYGVTDGEKRTRTSIKMALILGVQRGVLKRMTGVGASGSFKLAEKPKKKQQQPPPPPPSPEKPRKTAQRGTKKSTASGKKKAVPAKDPDDEKEEKKKKKKKQQPLPMMTALVPGMTSTPARLLHTPRRKVFATPKRSIVKPMKINKAKKTLPKPM